MNRHQPHDVGEERLGRLPGGRHRLDQEARLRPVLLGAADGRDQRPFVVADQEEPRGDADDRPLAHLHGHVLLRTGLRIDAVADPAARAALRSLGELRETHVPAALGREADVLVGPAARREVGVERDLEVRALPHRDLLRDDRKLGRIAAEVVANPRAERRLLDRRVRSRPRGEVAQRARQLLGFQRLCHLPTVAQTAFGGLTGSRRPCYNGVRLRLDRRSQDRRRRAAANTAED